MKKWTGMALFTSIPIEEDLPKALLKLSNSIC